MKLYFAPMEGITGYVFRNAYHACYSGIDTYYTPFLSNPFLNQIEEKDVLPENNRGLHVVPQILTNRVNTFLAIAGTLKDYGYSEVNLNLGCPSGTVVAKNRGSGALREPKELEKLLDGIYSATPLPVSVKCRIGIVSEAEWEDILNVLLKFPMAELIIHPRLQKDFYKGNVHPEAFRDAYRRITEDPSGATPLPLCYNGNVFTPEDHLKIHAAYPKLSAVMLGRGILMDPELPERLKELTREEGSEETVPESPEVASTGDASPDTSSELPTLSQPAGFPPAPAAPRHPDASGVARLRHFLDELLSGYCREMGREGPTLAKLKEVWSYLQVYIGLTPKDMRPLWKAGTLAEYKDVVTMLLQKC